MAIVAVAVQPFPDHLTRDLGMLLAARSLHRVMDRKAIVIAGHGLADQNMGAVDLARITCHAAMIGDTDLRRTVAEMKAAGLDPRHEGRNMGPEGLARIR